MSLPVKQTNPDFRVGIGTIGTSAAQLTTQSFAAVKGVRIQCTSGTIYIGTNSNVSSAIGYPIASAGDAVVEIAIDDPSKVWIIGADVGQGYNWVAS